RLVGHPAGEGAVADYYNNLAVRPTPLAGFGHAGGVAEPGGGVAVFDQVVLALAPVGIAAHAAQLAQPGKALPGPGEQLVHISLVSRVPEDAVTRAVEGPVEGKGQFDHPQVRPQMAAGARHRADQELPDLLGKLAQLGLGQLAQVRWPADPVKDRGGLKVAHALSTSLKNGRRKPPL